MPAGTYTLTLYTISGSGNNTFTVTGSFTITVHDPDDNFGIGDDDPATETGAAPVIQSLGAGAPSGWSVGDTFYFGGARGIESGSTADDYLIPKVDGNWQTSAALYSLPGASTPLVVGQSYNRLGASSNVDAEVMPCYAPGTRIMTPDGPRAVETLMVGDAVLTRDNGAVPIRWVRSDVHSLDSGQDAEKPVCIKAGALGHNLPAEDLIVSPQHRILVGGEGQLQDIFPQEVLVPAKALTDLPGIHHQKSRRHITWIHFACEGHEVVTANGCLSESLLFGRTLLEGMTAKDRQSVARVFQPVSDKSGELNGPPARACLSVGETRRRIASYFAGTSALGDRAA